MHTPSKTIIAALILFAVAGVGSVDAATLGVVANNATPMVGQTFHVDVTFDTQGDNANAIQGEVDFPSASLSLVGIEDGGSPISFWVQSPQAVASGVVAFSGIIPGGFVGAASSVIRLILQPISDGVANITLSNLQVLRNDGQATPISVTSTPATVSVSTVVATSSGASGEVSLITPAPFTPVISRDPNIYGGQYFLAFATTDKGSGIDHYEVLEVPTGPGEISGGKAAWQVATSPYLLKDQTLSSDIYVRAVDHKGNFIVVELPAEHPVTAKDILAAHWILIYELCGGTLAFLLLIIFLKRRHHGV